MTGQVKEDFITRMRETGIQIHDGKIVFRTGLLDPAELLNDNNIFGYFDPAGEPKQIPLKPGQLGFTFCQVPVVLSASEENKISVTFADGSQIFFADHTIGSEISSGIFKRTGEIIRIEVSLKNFRIN